MNPEMIPGFDCLEFKWKVQSEIYEKTKDMTVDEQIAFFRQAAETGPFATLWRAAHQKAVGVVSGRRPGSAVDK